jgi:hypothetical protein
VIGAIAGMVLASLYAAATSMPSREGGPGAFAVAIGFMLGGTGLVAGTVYGLYRVAGVSWVRIGGSVALAFAALALVFVGYRWYFTHSQAYFTRKHGNVPLEIEIRSKSNASARVQAALVEGDSGGAMPVEWDESGRLGTARLWQVTRNRRLMLDGKPLRLDLPAFPGEDTDWSPWTAVQGVAGLELRYRIRLGP